MIKRQFAAQQGVETIRQQTAHQVRGQRFGALIYIARQKRLRLHRAETRARADRQGGVSVERKGVQMVVSQKNQRLGAPFHDFPGHPAVAGEDLLLHVLGGHVVP